MVFMNGDNNLDSFAIQNFLDMANVGSTRDVNIVVQLDRSANGIRQFGDISDWCWCC